MIDARINHQRVAAELVAFEAKVERVTKVVQAKVALDVFNGVIKRSPVDTGRFRANWMLTVGEQPSDAYDASAGGTSRRPSSANQALASAVSLTGLEIGQAIWITNNTPYGIVLEAGHSDQAPNGVVLVTVLSVVERAQRALGGVV